MTFLEAAIEVLRDAEEPLHFSEIARRAVDQKLLSHVGRDPEAAMRGCLTSAVRGEPDDALIRRAKPAHYEIKPGADLPARPKKKKVTKKKVAAKKKPAAKKKAAKKKSTKKKSTRKKVAREPALAVLDEGDDAPPPDAEASAVPEIEFEAPSGSGLSGPTDVALVMANAMSRLADERPELKNELEAMQSQAESGAEPGPEGSSGTAGAGDSPAGEGPVVERRTHRGRTRVDGDEPEERGGRRRRRRRRRTKKLEWTATPDSSGKAEARLLDAAASILAAAGARSLHVRQIAEQLAQKNLLGGDISELERAVTSAMVLDVHRHGDGSRFDIRGDARYQLRGSRVPEGAAKAETALYAAAEEAERAANVHLEGWLGSLGARGFEALVRIYLEAEGLQLVASLPPMRGLGRLVVKDPDPEFGGRVLVVAVPAKTAVERKLWEGEAERNECTSVLVLAAGEKTVGDWGSDVRLITGPWFTRWLIEQGIGVRRIKLAVPVLDPSVIESIGGLDT